MGELGPRSASGILEFRQYRARRGRRADMVQVFDSKTIDALEDAGSEVLGQFIDLDLPHGWVLLRGWRDYADREAGSGRFYGGDLWRGHAAEFNATLSDCSNVRVLTPITGLSMVLPSAQRPGLGATPQLTDAQGRVLLATIWRRRRGGDLASWFGAHVMPTLESAGAELVGAYVSDPRPNNVPRRPVVEGESAAVTFAWTQSAAASEHLVAVLPEHVADLDSAPEHHRLLPTPRSWLR